MLRFFCATVTLMFLTGVTTAFAFDEVNKTTIRGLAVDGYDSVAYFSKKDATGGQGTYIFEWKGATWRFADADSRDQFAASPTAYAPQYGGYCSNQMSLGNISDIDPGVWLIHDGKLFLFGHQAGKDRWEKTGIEARIADADHYWQDFLAEK
ncbi:YHS domain-containing (seleno)protein [Sneathiella sp.]|uniref:YHS domain-containing (seleno)protein n=1 Tax=Sneathiella sp. TaxID=1964365 RepID=UPI003565E23D